MSTGAWIMLAFGTVVNYGLLTYFIYVAIKKGKERAERNRKRALEKDSPPTGQEGGPPAEESAEERCY